MMKSETIGKIAKIAKVMSEKYGIECLEFSNFSYLSREIGKNLKLNIADTTIKKHERYLRKKIKDDVSNMLFEASKSEVEKPKVDITELKMDIDKIVVHTKCGKQIVFKQEQTITRPVVAVVEEKDIEKPIWLGLFDYNDGVIIRKGKYAGCNVKSQDSIMTSFGSMSEFFSWVKWALEEGEKGLKGEKCKFAISSDTPKDVEILKKIVKSLEERLLVI